MPMVYCAIWKQTCYPLCVRFTKTSEQAYFMVLRAVLVPFWHQPTLSAQLDNLTSLLLNLCPLDVLSSWLFYLIFHYLQVFVPGKQLYSEIHNHPKKQLHNPRYCSIAKYISKLSKTHEQIFLLKIILIFFLLFYIICKPLILVLCLF